MSNRTLPPEALNEWAEALQTHFGLDTADLDISGVLDLARDVAHGVARPAAPFAAFIAGLVAGRSGGSPETVRQVLDQISDLARAWPDREAS